MNKLLSIKQIAIIAGAYLLCSCPVKADIRMPRIFGDHMVLQQDSQLFYMGMGRSRRKGGRDSCRKKRKGGCRTGW